MKEKTYQFNFKYIDLKSSGRKLIRAASEEEAIKKFNEIHKGYKVEITKIIDKGVNYKE